MDIELNDSFPPLSEAQLQQFERELRITLPKDYRAFLLKFNGGKPTYPCFTFVQEGRETSDCIRFFFGLRAKDFDDLRAIIEGKTGLIPNNMLPVGRTLANDLVCMSIAGEDIGQMYFWDGDWAKEGEPDYSNLYKVANSFSHFVGKLHTLPEDL